MLTVWVHTERRVHARFCRGHDELKLAKATESPGCLQAKQRLCKSMWRKTLVLAEKSRSSTASSANTISTAGMLTGTQETLPTVESARGHCWIGSFVL